MAKSNLLNTGLFALCIFFGYIITSSISTFKPSVVISDEISDESSAQVNRLEKDTQTVNLEPDYQVNLPDPVIQGSVSNLSNTIDLRSLIEQINNDFLIDQGLTPHQIELYDSQSQLRSKPKRTWLAELTPIPFNDNEQWNDLIGDHIQTRDFYTRLTSSALNNEKADELLSKISIETIRSEAICSENNLCMLQLERNINEDGEAIFGEGNYCDLFELNSYSSCESIPFITLTTDSQGQILANEKSIVLYVQ